MERTTSVAVLVSIFMLTAAVGCSDDEPTAPQGPFQLTFSGDASFQGPHGGQDVAVAVLRDGTVVETASGVVSGGADPSFSFDFPTVLTTGSTYEVHYWIDSNFGGGSPGVCDPKANDHQWRVDLGSPTADITQTEPHAASVTEEVCATFALDLEFSGDASFQGPHGDQDISVAVVRASDGLVVATAEGVVSAGADPAFAFSFPGALVRDTAYFFDYWIDSNFGGGAAGVCDPKANDHQWRFEIQAESEDVSVTDTHRAGETTDVCATFG